jgi:hypothetical protein
MRVSLASTIALIPTLMLASLAGVPTARAQESGASKEQKAAPAPRHDISGIWDPGNNGIQPLGPRAMPEDGKPEHQIPYTQLGLEALKTHKPSNGIRSVLPGETNDPVVYCDPQGMPREDLYELRTTQILQTPLNVVVLYQFGRIWRVIWTDGRDLPKDPEPRWFGYSIGNGRTTRHLLCRLPVRTTGHGSIEPAAPTARICALRRSSIESIMTRWNLP